MLFVCLVFYFLDKFSTHMYGYKGVCFNGLYGFSFIFISLWITFANSFFKKHQNICGNLFGLFWIHKLIQREWVLYSFIQQTFICVVNTCQSVLLFLLPPLWGWHSSGERDEINSKLVIKYVGLPSLEKLSLNLFSLLLHLLVTYFVFS